MNKLLTMGVIGSYHKKNEKRAPIDPAHFEMIDEKLRQHIYVEAGYGERFWVSDEELGKLVAGILPREQLFEKCDIILLPKPTEGDFSSFKEGQILWGWPHCVQGEGITQVAIDKKMTLIAWEEMHVWRRDGAWDMHTFQKNNELAGYCSVLHALQIAGITGTYGTFKKAAVLGFGSTGRGAIAALKGQGFHDLHVFTQRESHVVAHEVPGIIYHNLDNDGLVDDMPIAQVLSEYDIIVNCILQNTDKPLMYMQGDEIDLLANGTLIVDVSCDAGMGFEFARPTSFENPSFEVKRGIIYYAVDHSPSYLWRTSTYEISQAVLPYIEVVMGGKEAWVQNSTIAKAIEIEDGVIRNPKILTFQNREETYPHQIKLG